MIEALTRDELLDWLALYEVSPWGPERDDFRAAAHSLWVRGVKTASVIYPYVEQETEIDDELIAMLDADRAASREGEAPAEPPSDID